MASSLNPRAEEWKPRTVISTYLPHVVYRGAKLLQTPPPPPQLQLQAAAAPPLPPHYVYYGCVQWIPHFDRQCPAYSPCADVAPAAVMKAAAERRQLKKVLPPRLMRFPRCRSFQLRGRPEAPKSIRKIWKPLKKSGGSGGDSSPPVPGNTTVMIKNIPNQYRRDCFMDFLDKYCLESNIAYDFLYLPMDFKTNNNVGYAFVNFTTAAGATRIREVLQNYQWGVLKTPSGFFTSKKICDVTWARIQGKSELVRHFQRSNFICGTCDYLPVVFSPPRNGAPNGAQPQPIGNIVGGALLHQRKA